MPLQQVLLTRLQQIPLTQLRIDPKNLRTSRDYAQDNPQMVGQIQSMRVNGQLQPARVVDLGDGTFLLRVGHRRYWAATYLGWETLECVIEDPGRENDDLVPLIENSVRVRPDSILAGKLISQKLDEGTSYAELSRITGIGIDVLREFAAIYTKHAQLTVDKKMAIERARKNKSLKDSAIRAAFKREGLLPEVAAEFLIKAASRKLHPEQMMTGVQKIQRDFNKRPVSAKQMDAIIADAAETSAIQTLVLDEDYQRARQLLGKDVRYLKHFLGELVHIALADDDAASRALLSLHRKHNIGGGRTT